MAKTTDRNAFYLSEKIGDKRSTTPEGFLVCHDVAIARTGQQVYSDREIPVEGGPDGLIRIDRPNEEVFRPEIIASFEGKPVTVEHPNEFVSPENWKQLSVGFVQNVRRGEGINDDLLVADLVITDQAAIKYVNDKLPEVSAGYEANYEQTEPGKGVQRGIVGNHVALVERGRAGPRCAIQDKELTMPEKKPSLLDRLKAFVDSQGSEMEKEEEKEEETKDSDALEARIARIEAAIEKLAAAESKEVKDTVLEAETAETNKEAVGTVLTGDSLAQMVSRAEILAPGVGFKTVDAKKAERAEVDAHMRETLEKAMKTADGAEAIAPLLAGRDLKTLTSDSLAGVFIGAAEIMRVKNNLRVAGAAQARTKDFGTVKTVADINAQNRKFWADRGVVAR